MKFTKEQIRKAMNCKTVDELLAYAKSEGVELSCEQAEEYIAQLGKRKLTDEDSLRSWVGLVVVVVIVSARIIARKKKKNSLLRLYAPSELQGELLKGDELS